MQKRLNSTQIENAGVDAVSSYFNFSGILDPNIPKRDKEPVWDGKLYLYKSNSDKQSKTGLIGFIPVQVKGRQFKDFSNSQIKYDIELNDVAIYQQNGGVAFFVVYVNAETRATKIYYNLLAPVDLRTIAKRAGKKKKIRIEFKELPELCTEIDLQFKDFYIDCHKQHSVSNQEPIHFQDVENDIASINVQFSAQTSNYLEALQHFTSTAHFCYVTLKGDPTNTPHPIGEGRINFKAQSTADVPVIVGGKQYFDQIRHEVVEGKSYILVGDCLRIPFSKDPSEIGRLDTQNIKLSFNTLSQRLRNYEFILAVKNDPIIKLGNTYVKIENVSFDDDFLRIHESDKNLQDVLEHLHVKEDLVLDKVVDSQVKTINTLIEHYLYGKRVIPDNDVDHSFIRLEIGNIALMFLAEKVDDPNLYKLHSVHDLSNFVFTTQNDIENIVLLPAFIAFSTETYRDVCNISYETFIGQCEQYKSNDNRLYQAVNWSVLRMLNAFDQQTNKKNILVDTAQSLNQWLIDNDPDINSALVHRINRLQIIRRKQELSHEEKEIAFDLLDDANSSDEVKFACYTLLDNKQMATRYFSKFASDTQEFYKTLPIYNIFSTLKEK